MKSRLRTMLAFTLCVALCLGLVPAAFADGGSETAQEFGESAYAAYEGMGPYGVTGEWEAMLQTEPGELLAGAAPADGLLSEEGWRLGASSATVKLPAGTTVIEDEAFLNDQSITSISIPKSVTRIGDGAFYGCTNLKAIYYNGTFSEFLAIQIGGGNDPLGDAILYCINGTYQIPFSEAHFPDEGFRYYVFENFDSNNDGWLSNAEAAAVTNVSVNNMEISDLTGIQYFTELTSLSCYGNQLTSLDVSHNRKLLYLICGNAIMDGSEYGIPYGNYISTLDVSHNPLLKVLWCPYNKLTELDVSQNLELTELGCYGNQITSLDTRLNTKLQRLLPGGNPLGTIDVSQNKELLQLNCYNNGLTSLNLSNNKNLTFLWCNDNNLNSLDLTNQAGLQNLNCSGNSLTTLNLSNKRDLVRLVCFSNSLSSLNVSGCTALQYVNCENNQLSTLTVTGCTNLKELYCWTNQLTSLNLSQNTTLVRVNVSANNNLSSLTLGNLENLRMLWIQNTNLTSIDIRNLPLVKYEYLYGIELESDHTAYSGDWLGYTTDDGPYPEGTRTVDHCWFCVDEDVQVIYQ